VPANRNGGRELDGTQTAQNAPALAPIRPSVPLHAGEGARAVSDPGVQQQSRASEVVDSSEPNSDSIPPDGAHLQIAGASPSASAAQRQQNEHRVGMNQEERDPNKP